MLEAVRSCVRGRARTCSRSCVSGRDVRACVRASGRARACARVRAWGGARARAHVCAVVWPDQRLGAKAQPEGQEMRMKQQLSEASPTQLESPASPWTRPWPSASAACVPSSPRRGPGACDRWEDETGARGAFGRHPAPGRGLQGPWGSGWGQVWAGRLPAHRAVATLLNGGFAECFAHTRPAHAVCGVLWPRHAPTQCGLTPVPARLRHPKDTPVQGSIRPPRSPRPQPLLPVAAHACAACCRVAPCPAPSLGLGDTQQTVF